MTEAERGSRASEFRTLSGAARSPTYAEREIHRMYVEAGVEDVVLDPENTPDTWWQVAMLLTDESLLRDHYLNPTYWNMWLKEMRYRQGWPQPISADGRGTYKALVTTGVVAMEGLGNYGYPVSVRLAGIETLLDVVKSSIPLPELIDDFTDRLNERSRWFRVGLRLADNRFIAVKSEHLHTTIVEPTLLLLHDPRFAPVDELYRKAFDRYLRSDLSGVITVATSAVETMLRLGLGVDGFDLEQLGGKARSKGWLPAGVAETAKKLHALRADSDAHSPGTNESELAMFALHLAGSILLYLGDTFPVAE